MQMADILATVMDVVLNFGNEPVKDVDSKLEILKFNYSWIEEVERQERLMKEVIQPVLVEKDEKKIECQVKMFTKETKELPREPVLDFGQRPVKNLFNYSWADVVEEDERRTKEDNETNIEKINKKEMESNVKIFREERNEILREPILDFGEGPVTNLEEKLEILKFPYKWADIVEEEERGTKEPPIFNKTSLQDDLEHQKVTEKEGNAKQEIPPDNVSETKDLPQLLKAETEAEKKTKELEVSKMETQQIKPELLSNDEDENENFVPRKLFLFGVVEFKSDWKQINKNAEQPNTPKKSTNVFNSATEPVPKVTTVKKRTSISRKIKTFLGFR